MEGGLDSAETVARAGRGRNFRQTVCRHWLRCMCMKRRDDEKGRFCSSRSKLDPIPLQSKELGRNDEKDTNPSKIDPIPLDLEIEILTRLPAKSLMNQDDEKDTRPSKVDSVPLDLEIEILTRLPAKSLIKLQCVSKMWSSIIRSQRFVDSYYAMSSATRPDRFIITFGTSTKIDDMRLLVFSSSYGDEKSSSLATNLETTIPSVCFLCQASYCPSVHGLIGYTMSGKYMICNPTTNKYTILPCPGPRTFLGYDPVGGQFKALTTMVCYPHRPPDHVPHEVLTLGGGESSWTRNKFNSPPYYKVTKPICINGFVYYGAWTPTRSTNPVIVCFDVRYERLSFIEAPMSVVAWEGESILIEYKGKLASIVRHPYAHFHSFDLWILEDVKKHDWSVQSFELPFSLGMGRHFTSPGINRAGEIIFAPTCLSRDVVQPFYIFYYNVERKDMRRVRLLGIADDEEFRRRYGIARQCHICISPEHVESIGYI